MPNVDSSGRDSFGRRVETGLAAELFKQLKPLLLESDIDLDSGKAYTIDEINDGLQVAIQRHNFIMAVPTGEARKEAFRAIRLAAEYLWEADYEDFSDFLTGMTPDEEPTPAQIIGTTLSLLDPWFEDEVLTGAIARPSFTERWDEESSKIMYEIFERAREHRAFDSYSEFIGRWGGLVVMTFAIGVVFEGLYAWSEDDDYFVDVADELLDPEAW
ncbi:hypothetical protein V8Z69_17680 [Microbacterium aurugineum]|uniref:hypothetical protein n=2 Tax=Microbacteriaceae TaxID=85023 RepID=UPI00203B5127|nr:hypothetical protein [Microbacterium sp. USTB-Y]